MRLFLSFLLINVHSIVLSQNQDISKNQNSFKKHDKIIADNYTWLEDLKSVITLEWVEKQNNLTSNMLNEVKKKYDCEKRIKEFNEHRTRRLPKKKEGYYYSISKLEKNTLPSIFYRKKMEDKSIKIIDLDDIFENKNILISQIEPSKSNSYIAYSVSQNGGDKTEIRFVDVHKKEKIDDIIYNAKFTNLEWNLDYGVFYKKNNNVNSIAVDSTNQLYYHRLGTNQADDKLIFDTSKSQSTFTYYSTRGRLIIIETNKDETLNNFYEASLADNDFVLRKFIENQSTDMKFLDYRNGKIYYSSKDFEWGEIRCFNINNRNEETVIIPQIYSHLLASSFITEKYIFCLYKTIDRNYIRVYDSSGNFIRKFDSPENFDIQFNFFDDDSKNLFVSMESYVTPAVNYKLNIETGEMSEFYNEYIKAKSTIFPVDFFETKNMIIKSRDNKDIPITIIHKKGIKLDGNNPTLLKAYGGFGAISYSNFDAGLLCFLEKGGIFVYSKIRGGGDKGLKWQKDGKGLKKINSFNDFIDTAEFLIKEKYTSPNKLAITGGSNGGLVVGVAMTQRPDLFKVAIPEMGAFDMVKFDLFTVGKYHLDEYGDPNNKEEFDMLLSYSPLHKVTADTNYPICLVITSDNDDRVPPLHSYKFVAKLQDSKNQKNPIYLKSYHNSGHYGKVANYDDYIKSEADFYNFLMFHLMN